MGRKDLYKEYRCPKESLMSSMCHEKRVQKAERNGWNADIPYTVGVQTPGFKFRALGFQVPPTPSKGVVCSAALPWLCTKEAQTRL